MLDTTFHVNALESDSSKSKPPSIAHPPRLKPTPYLLGSVCYLLGSMLFLIGGLGAQGDLGEGSGTHLWGDLYTAGNVLFVVGSMLFVVDGYKAAVRG